jgi:hypothetical protein
MSLAPSYLAKCGHTAEQLVEYHWGFRDIRFNASCPACNPNPAPTISDVFSRLDALAKAFDVAQSITTQKLEALTMAATQLQTQIAALQAEVAKDTTVIGGATTLINGFGARLEAAINAAMTAGVAPADLQALTDLQTQLGTSSDALAAAVAANTPADSAPAVP